MSPASIIMGDDRPIAYVEDGTVVYRISGLGSCIKALVAARLGYEALYHGKAKKILFTAAEEGNLHEPAVIEKMRESGFVIDDSDSQTRVEVPVRKGVILRGHIDGIITDTTPDGGIEALTTPAGVEVKTMSKSVFKEWASYPDLMSRLTSNRFRKYGFQVSAYMKATRMPFVYVVKCRDDGSTLIEWLPKPPFPWGKVVSRIAEVESWVKKGELPDCEPTVSKYFCPFIQLHDDDLSPFGDEDDTELPPIESPIVVALAGMAERYLELQTELVRYKALDEQRKDLGKEIVGLIGTSGPKTTNAGEFKITRVDSSFTVTDWVRIAEDLSITTDEAKKLYSKKKPIHYPKVMRRIEGEG